MYSINRHFVLILIIYLIILTLSPSPILSSIRHGSLSGFITNHETGQPLPDANIIIENTRYGTASRDGGFYAIKNLPFGTYTIRIQVIGFKVYTQDNFVIEGPHSLNVALIPSPIPINPIVKTANGFDHLQNHISESSTVFSKIRFKECNGNTAGEIVENTSSLYIRNYGGFAGIKALSIRGSESSQVLVLLDGFRLNSSQDGSVDINAIPVEALERIEIIRGGNSSLLGTDAMGGAINLITHESLGTRDFSYQFRTITGSFGTFGWSIQGARKLRFGELFLNYNKLESDGNYEYTDYFTMKKVKRDNNNISQNNLFTKFKMQPFQHAVICLTYQQLNSERGVPGSTVYPSPKASRKEERQMFGFQYEHQLSHQLRLESRGYYHRFDNQYQDPAGWIPVDSRHNGKAFGGDVLTSWSIDHKFNLQAGIEYRYDEIESTDIANPDRNIFSIFIRGEWDPSTIFYTSSRQIAIFPGVRLDKYSDINTQVSPKVGFVYKRSPNSKTTLKGNVGTAFRAPTFNDLYWPEDFFSKGNPSLRPETSFNADIGLVHQNFLSQLFQWESTIFYNRIKELIQWQPNTDSKWMPTNIGTAEIRGIENSCTFRTSENRFYFKVGHSWMHAKDMTKNASTREKSLIFRPKVKYDLQTGYQLRSFYLNIHYCYIDQQFRDGQNSNICPSYHLLNGNVGFNRSFQKVQFDIKLQAYNIINKEVEIFSGYPLPGREFRISTGIKY